MITVIWSQSASDRLSEIFDYISYESGSEKIALRYIIRLLNKTEQLQIAPLSGPKEPFFKKHKGNFRFILEGNYKIIYEVTPSAIYIYDIFHMKQNPSKINQRK